MSTTTTSNTAVVLELIEALNRHDVDGMRRGWSDQIWERFPDGTYEGPDGVGAYFQALFDAIPDVHFEVVATAEQGDAVFLRWKATGTHTGGRFQGIDVTGKRFELDGIDHFTVRDGKVVSNFVVFDQMAIGRALGLLPPDGSAAERAMKTGFNAMTALKARVKR